MVAKCYVRSLSMLRHGAALQPSGTSEHRLKKSRLVCYSRACRHTAASLGLLVSMPVGLPGYLWLIPADHASYCFFCAYLITLALPVVCLLVCATLFTNHDCR